MAALKELLPPAKSTSSSFYDHSKDSWFKERFSSSSEASDPPAAAVKPNPAPPYGKRSGFVPRKPEDFGDGGAFPEILVAQYPLGMGRKDSKPGSNILALTVDSRGKVAFDAVVKQNENSSKIVYSQHKDLVPKIGKEEPVDEEDEELQKEIEETTERTKAALEKIVNVRLSAAQPKNVPTQSSESKFIKYKPSQQSAAFNSGAKERIVRMVEMPVDPLEPPKFKHKRVPKASGSPPVPVMHSPPRPVTVKDQQDWKIPPCISNWKNPKGYTIPLDKRLAADGRGLQEVQINDNFAKLSEALYVAEQKAREAVAMRSKVQRELMLKEKDRKEQELRNLAAKARVEKAEKGNVVASAAHVSVDRTGMVDDDMRPEHHEQRKETREEREERIQRDKIREERRRERERERRLEAKDAAMGKKSKITRDRDRDISEKVALGMANTGAGRTGEVMYDQRLFNQEKGMESGFAADDQYNIYDKGLFTAQPTLSTLFRPKKDTDADMYGPVSKKKKKERGLSQILPTSAMAPLLLVLLLLASSAASADEDAFIGVNIGTALSDMPSPTQVVALLKSQQIRHIRLYDADLAMLTALANTGISITVSIPNEQLLGIGQSNATAANWVAKNVVAHVPAVNITAIAVGSEVLTALPNAAPVLVNALKFVHSALVAANLDRQIKVSTPHSSSIILDSFPPSQAFFNRTWDPVVVPMLRFLQSTGSYLMLNVYPYYDYMQSNGIIPLDYALFRPLPPNKEAVDANTLLHYTNVFDAVVDAAYFAMAYLNVTNVPVVVLESGWPRKGDSNEPDATVDNSDTYNSNLILHVLNNTGTPKHPGIAVSTYIYELYDEDLRPGALSEKFWGLFDSNGVPVYTLHLTGSGMVLANDTTNQTYCIAKTGADSKMLQAALDWACGPGKVDCSALLQGQPCYDPDSVEAHATYAFNAYYHIMGMSSGTCYFNGVAAITTTDPSHGSCIFPGSGGKNGTFTNGTSLAPASNSTSTQSGAPHCVYCCSKALLQVIGILLSSIFFL